MPEIEKQINPHFEDYFFDWEHEEYIIVGGYGSSKSYNTAFKILMKLYEEERTAIVVREVFDTLRDTCFALFEELIEELGLKHHIKAITNPMRIVYSNNKSRIIFKGMDKPLKLKSLNNVTIGWLEEAAEIKYAGYKELSGRLRHPKLSTHLFVTSNPVSRSTWVYQHFFANTKRKPVKIYCNEDDFYKHRILSIKNQHFDRYYHHSTVDDNMFVQDSYIKKLDALEEIDVDLYRVARLGRFGAIGTKVLPQIKILPYQEAMRKITSKQLYIKRIGMDFGFSTSYNAVVEMWIDNTDEYAQDLYIVWEYYKNQMTDNRTVIDLKGLRSSGDLIFADGAEPKTIAYFQQEGFNIVAASEAKSKGARVQNTKKVKRFRNIFIADNCINCINELEDLTIKLDSNTGDEIPGEFNIDPHTFSAIWYGLEGYEVADIKEALLDEHSIFKLNEVDFTGNYLW